MNCDFEIVGDRFRCRRCGQEVPRRGEATRAYAQCLAGDGRPRRAQECVHYLGEGAACGTCRGNVVTGIRCAVHGEVPRQTCQGCGDWKEIRNAEFGMRNERTPHSELRTPHSLLLRFHDGLGDHVQFQVVLRHLRELRPDLTVDVACSASCVSMLSKLCRRAFPWPGPEPARYEFYFTTGPDATYKQQLFVEPTESFSRHPSGKAEECLRRLFGIVPREELCGYEFEPSAQAKLFVEEWLTQSREDAKKKEAEESSSLGVFAPLREPFCLLHYRGRALRHLKVLDEQAVVAACRVLNRAGILPVILDFDQHSCFSRNRFRGEPPEFAVVGAGHPLWNGRRFADAEILCALAQQATLCIGVDSGPGHLFQASGTPTIIVWPQPGKIHPLHHSGHGARTLHLLHRGHEVGIREPKRIGLDYFYSRYHHRIMRGNLRSELPDLVEELLSKNG